MEKKVTISQSTLYTGFLLITTINALNTAMTDKAQNNISVIFILAVGNLFYISAQSTSCFGVFVRLCNRVRDQQVFFVINKSFTCIVGLRKSLTQINRIFRTSLFTQSAKNTAQHIDFIFGC